MSTPRSETAEPLRAFEQASPPVEAAPRAAAAAPMGARVGRSAVWMLINGVVMKLLSFLAQIALGWLLLEKDFGYYAIATSITSFLGVFRTGGARDLLIQGGAAAGDRPGRSLLWYAIACDAASGAVLLALAPLAARVYDAPVIAWMLVVQGICTPLCTPGVMLSARLIAELRHREFGNVAIAVNLTRYGGTIILAAFGFGAMSFVYPLPVVSAVEYVLARHYAGRAALPGRIEPWRWPAFLRQGKWIVFTTFAGALFTHGENLIIGLFVAPEIMGVYFFAQSLVKQAGAMLAWNLHQVLFPAFSRMEGEWERQRQAMLRALSALSLAMAVFCGVQAAAYDALERLLWHGKWDATVLPMIVAAILYPMRMMFTVAEAACYARLRFRLLGGAYLVLGVTMVGAALAGAAIWGTPLAMTIMAGSTQAVVCLGLNLAVLKVFEIPRRSTLRATVPAWLLIGAIAAAVAAGDRLLKPALESAVAPDGGRWALAALDFARGAVNTAAFLLLSLLAARLTLPDALRELLRIAPRGYGKRPARWLRLEA